MSKVAALFVLWLTVVGVYYIYRVEFSQPVHFSLFETYSQGFLNPTLVVRNEGQFVIAQMRDGSILQTTNLYEPRQQSLSLAPGSKLQSPHFITSSDQGDYVSDGRSDVIAFYPRERAQAGVLLGKEWGLNRPHGVCLDSKGWLYVADSVNSRLIRWHTVTGAVQAFADNQKVIAYGRQILCRRDGLWISNSYEGAFKLNLGRGGNVLRIVDFESGDAELIYANTDTNFTGIEIVNNRYLVVGRWSGKYDVIVYDLKKKVQVQVLSTYEEAFGAPYGMFADNAERTLYVSYLGMTSKEPNLQGGVKLYRW